MLRRLVPTTLLATAGALLLAAAPANAAETPNANEVADALQSDQLYIADSIPDDTFPQAGQDAMQQAAQSAENPTYLLIFPSGAFQSKASVESYMAPVIDDVGKGNYAILAGDQQLVVESTMFDESAQEQVKAETLSGSPNQVDALVNFPEAADAEVASAANSAISGAVLLGVLVLAMAGGGFFLYSSKKKRERQAAKELEEIKQMAAEDVTRLGEDISALDIDLTTIEEPVRVDYTHAMDSYDRAKSKLDTIQRTDQIKQVTTALEDGRFYMTATRARLNGDTIPERRAPCFFNPQHGPSQDDVDWAPPGGSSREVPACSSCRRSVLSGHNPSDVRMVEVNGQRRPYYDAGPAYAPYAGGYYGGDLMMGMFTGMMMGSMMGSMMGGGMMGGMEGGGDMGGDMGGGDFGGGMDFGGFDF